MEIRRLAQVGRLHHLAIKATPPPPSVGPSFPTLLQNESDEVIPHSPKCGSPSRPLLATDTSAANAVFLSTLDR